MKKIFAFALVALFSLSMASCCGNKKAAPADAAAVVDVPEAPETVEAPAIMEAPTE